MVITIMSAGDGGDGMIGGKIADRMVIMVAGESGGVKQNGARGWASITL